MTIEKDFFAEQYTVDRQHFAESQKMHREIVTAIENQDMDMAYRKMQEGANIVVLKISLDVALFRYTMFSDMNATDSLHSQGGDLAALQKIRFAATQREYVRHDDADFKYLQAEVMVKTFIPLQYIENINNINTVVYDDLPF